MVRRVADFDVVHCHIDWIFLPFLSRANVPFITTLHGRLDIPGLSAVIDLFPNAPFISISDNQRLPLRGARWLGTVYHGLPQDSLRPSYSPGNYLAFLGRLTEEKGPEAAIRIARATGMSLRMAAKIPRANSGYFKDKLKPMIDGHQIQITGEVDDNTKEKFLGDAAALLFPIDWPEPFGLVMIEAMACGTPVIAFRSGSVPEVIEEGVTGFIVESEDEAIQAVKHVLTLDRRKVRHAFEKKFTARRMAQDYLRYYEQLVRALLPSDQTPIQSKPGMLDGETAILRTI
jgi:glycosyltransferase involved in cell wall biosynthesis